MTMNARQREGLVRVVFQEASPEDAAIGNESGDDAARSTVSVDVAVGTTLYDAAIAAGLSLHAPCGGAGSCGKCRVIGGAGLSEPTASEVELLSEKELATGGRLACQAAVLAEAAVRVPPGSMSDGGHRILTDSAVGRAVEADSAAVKAFVELPEPGRGDDVSDVCRLRRALNRPVQVELDLLRLLPARLRECGFRGTAVTLDDRLVDFEPGDTSAECFAVALDVGTTTMAAELVDVKTGRVLAVGSRMNPQTAFGDDVLSRIVYTQNHADGLATLHGHVVAASNELIRGLLEETSVRETAVYQCVVSGNTTMQQLFLAVDPQSLGVVPFVPATAQGVRVRAAEIGLSIHPRGEVRTLPIIGGFVGGDISAGILATESSSIEGPALFVDIGTNGEIVLWTGERLVAASTAAGPAFEGARISQGMRACRGAVDRIAYDGALEIHVIGETPPIGLCGSALIDLAALLLRHGAMTPEGRLLKPQELPSTVPDALRDHLIDGAFVLASADESGIARPLCVTQRDFRELQLASGAIRAGVLILLNRSGLRPDELRHIFLAGGFGNFIRRDNARRIGLLPSDVPGERVEYRGNTSLAGARLVAISRECARAVERTAASCEHVDLSADPGFQMAFAEAMLFPEA